jgi:hypothetical protein
MKCRNHPDRESVGICQKHEIGFCQECCECLNIDHCCECIDPKLYCKFRTQCIIWEKSRDRRKKEVDEETRGQGDRSNSDCGLRNEE